MLAVTGATGNVGSELVRRLSDTGAAVRALSRDPHPNAGTVDWHQVGSGDTAALRKALDGVTKVALITAVSEDMAKREAAVVEAARAAGVQHIVKLSGLGAGPAAPIRLAQQHYHAEELIKGEQIPYTFVRPNLFMQALLASADTVRTDGVVYAPAGDGAISFTDLSDVVSVLAAALTEPGHENKTYEITGPEALTFTDAAQLITKTIGREVSFNDVPEDSARAGMLSAGLSPWVAEAFIELYRIYRAGHGSAVLSEPITVLTGQPATTLEAFLDRNRAHFS